MALHENADSDEWQAVLNTDESFPGSDIELVNEATGEVLAISLEVAAGALATLWPFTLAYLRGRISDEQLGAAFTRVLGDSGVALAARVSYALVLGPVFVWYLLARGVLGLTRAAAEIAEEGVAMDGKPQYRLKVFHPGTGSRLPAGTMTERDNDQRENRYNAKTIYTSKPPPNLCRKPRNPDQQAMAQPSPTAAQCHDQCQGLTAAVVQEPHQ